MPDSAGKNMETKSDLLPLNGIALLAEDNPYFAVAAVGVLQDLGAAEVVTTANVADSLDAFGNFDFCFALLDLALGKESCEPIAEKCLETKVPFVFASGYGRHSFDPKIFGHVPLIIKPFGEAQVRNALSQIDRGPA